jgi:hypothetical protein
VVRRILCSEPDKHHEIRSLVASEQRRCAGLRLPLHVRRPVPRGLHGYRDFPRALHRQEVYRWRIHHASGVDIGGRGLPRANLLGPGQSDFGRIDVSTVKGALGSMHWNVDPCPIAMQLKKPAAVDGPALPR